MEKQLSRWNPIHSTFLEPSRLSKSLPLTENQSPTRLLVYGSIENHGDSIGIESRTAPVFYRQVLSSLPKVLGIFHESWFCANDGSLA